MVEIPGKEAVEVLEARIGKGGTTALVWLAGIAFAVLCLGIIVVGLRATFAWLQPFLPSKGWADWPFRVAVVALYGFGFWYLMRKLRGVETQSDFQQHLNRIERAEAEINAETARRMTQIDERLKYIEKKVGDELHDVLVKRVLDQKGLSQDEIQQAQKRALPPADLSRSKKPD